MATYYNQLNSDVQNSLISEILSIYSFFRKDLFFDLISATNEIGGVSFVSIKGYCSDASNNTEIADQLINIGASYQNMQTNDHNRYKNCDFNVFCTLVDDFSLKYINTDGLSEFSYKVAIKNAYPNVLTELLNPKQSAPKADNFIHFNKVLAYNTNTKNLSIFGMQVNKSVVVKSQSEPKIVKSKPETITKQLIQQAVGSRTSTLRRFNIGNITKQINIIGDKIVIG